VIERVQMFVAAWDQKQAWVIFASSTVCADVFATSPSIADFVGGGLTYPPGDGLWMWEGMRELDDLGEFGEATYKDGTWRRPTDAEARAAASGDNPLLGDCG
jgi:hypothetical protein